jgi:hypothetical protein
MTWATGNQRIGRLTWYGQNTGSVAPSADGFTGKQYSASFQTVPSVHPGNDSYLRADAQGPEWSIATTTV